MFLVLKQKWPHLEFPYSNDNSTRHWQLMSLHSLHIKLYRQKSFHVGKDIMTKKNWLFENKHYQRLL